MIFRYIKKKLGIAELTSALALLLKNQKEEKEQRSKDVISLLDKLETVHRSTLQCTIALEKDSYQTANTLIELDEKFKNIRKEILSSLKDSTVDASTKTKEIKKQLESYQQFVVDERKAYEATVEKLIVELDEKSRELVPEIKPVVVEEKKEEKKKESEPIVIAYNDDVLDKNYFNALVNNVISNCYNSSDIGTIPSGYSVFQSTDLKKVGSGLQNRHCYDNALIFGKERQERICIGVIFSKSSLSQVLLDEEKKKKLTITPYLHTWNLTGDGKIADYTLGHKRAEGYVYVGRILASFNDLSAKGLEETLRKETIR